METISFLLFKIFFICLTIKCISCACSSKKLLVQTNCGAIQGTILNNHCKPVRAWLGIPYAQKPIGSLRFRPPISVGTWNGILEAFQEHNACVQNPYNNFDGAPDYSLQSLKIVYI